MTSQADELKEAFQKQLKTHFFKEETTPQAQKAKIKSWDHFLKLGLPHRGMEVYRYVKLRKLYSKTFSIPKKKDYTKEKIQPYVLSDCKNSLIVMINGNFHPELSCLNAISEKAFVLPMHQAMHTYGAFLSNHLTKSLKEETDPFAALNGALSDEGCFLYFPSKTQYKTPVQILNLIDAETMALLASPRIHFFMGTHSDVNIILTNECLSGENYFCNQYVDFFIEEGARVTLKQLNIGNAKSSWCFDTFRATLKRDSSFRTISITNGAETVRSDIRVRLIGNNAEASLNGLWILNESRESHTNVLIDHEAPHCRSQQLFKGVLDNHSHSSFEGKIYVAQAAQKTDAFQLNNNLLLSDHANAESRPNLEIFADDVKASHGATVGQLDKEQLFYLHARGISTELAKSILVKGFCQEVIGQMQEPAVTNKINTEFS